jgi:BirA family biotin operon repressor/biotin-[acetyl-CoA-carboxylase] ligase
METNYKHFDTIDSTNNWGKQNCHLFDAKKITLITAEMQTAGRGRFKREWVSPNENIYATFCFAVNKSRADIGNIPQVLALSAAQVMETLQFEPKLKWPNDVLLSNKKIAGILCETVSFENHFMVILGIGLNVNMPLDIVEHIDRPATSLLIESGKKFNVKTVLDLLEKQFKIDFQTYLKKGFSPFLAKYKHLMWTGHGNTIRFHDNLALIEGSFHSINEDGTINLKLTNGDLKRFLSGEFLS